MPLSPEKTVFRLRECPGDKDAWGLRELLCGALGKHEGFSVDDINIQSLAMDYGVSHMKKTATLMFSKLPRLVNENQKEKQWSVPLGSGCPTLILDIDFEGFTPLNDPEPERHEYDCIIISGLASHPFGSWQPKGKNKGYMWVRDTLPRHIPNVRAIIYGYDTKLVDSYSFKSIPEVASTFIEHLVPTGEQSSQMKPLVFLAHSLGGIIVKQMLVTLSQRQTASDLAILNRARGGIFFGVPSHGMAQGPLLAMVANHPNVDLVKVLAKNSPYLYDLDKDFAKIGRSRRMTYHWAYETKESPTVEKLGDGSFSRTGPRQRLVTRESATRGLWGSSPNEIFSIDEDHSDMVKFRNGSSICEQVVLKRFRGICKSQEDSQEGLTRRMATVSKRKRPETTPETPSTGEWTLADLLDSLLVPEWDGRYKTIEDNTPDTFEWFMDDKKTTFYDWLRKNERGLFWIYSKSGSGKSTLMKYIDRNRLTGEGLAEGHLVSGVTEIKVRHCFYGQGTLLQKSLEGMLRSMLYQIVKEEPSLAQQLAPLVRGKPPLDVFRGWTMNEFQRCLHLVLNQNANDICILFLIDALDEYDGGPAFIAKFLKDLVREAGKRTCVKILFSSRKWDAFLKEFADTPQLCLDDHNDVDISCYCKERLSIMQPDARQFFERIIPDIVSQSQGVFIWAKLVFEKLLVADNPEEAWVRFQTECPELNDYYMKEVQRIKREDRWDAYVLFQFASMMANSDYSDVTNLHIIDIIRALAVSRCTTYQDCRARMKELDSKVFPNSFAELANRTSATTLGTLVKSEGYDGWLFERAASPAFIEEQIKRVPDCTGGLVQILRPDTPSLQSKAPIPQKEGLDAASAEEMDKTWIRRLQFRHQSIKDFVERPGFRELLLGDDRFLEHENVYTFLAKLYLTRGRTLSAHTFCHLSEETTAHSLASFVKTMDRKAFVRLASVQVEFRTQYNTFWFSAMVPTDLLTFGVIYDLPLCVEDTVRGDPGLIKNTPRPLLKGWPVLGRTDHHIQIIKFLLQEGYPLDGTKQEYQDMLWTIGAMQYTAKMRGSHHWVGQSTKLKAQAVLDAGQDPNVLLYGQRVLPGQRVRFTSVHWRPMHVADTEFAQILLAYDADINLDDGQGNTPLDWMLAHKDTPKGRKRRGLNHDLYLGAAGLKPALQAEIRSKIIFLIRNGEAPALVEGATLGAEALSPIDMGMAFDPDDETASMKARREASLNTKGLHDDIEEIERYLGRLAEEKAPTRASSSLEPTNTAGSTSEKTSRGFSRLFKRTSK
ncbi:hypothetical protein VPNG_06451 [Cytospora leucostoma]|uniref:Nephrocystin 3-like N-terminal domain-containing protein n=1 Tax=Cytospora leucostoma TaxID=1230097 RepID=A0A423WYY5_9PEZI|nr:hypothetical protein VPNG_06451 [Cytospora leucostoma]